MPGGTGELGPVAATSTRSNVWWPNRSELNDHHTGSGVAASALEAVFPNLDGRPRPSGPVLSHAEREFWVLRALIPASVINSRATPNAIAAAVTAGRTAASLSPLTVRRIPRRITTRPDRAPV